MYQLLIAGVLPHVQFENNFLLNMHIHSVVVKVCAVIGAAQLVGVRLLTRNHILTLPFRVKRYVLYLCAFSTYLWPFE